MKITTFIIANCDFEPKNPWNQLLIDETKYFSSMVCHSVLWKLRKFSLNKRKDKKNREINASNFFRKKLLLSRNFCQKRVSAHCGYYMYILRNSMYFHEFIAKIPSNQFFTIELYSNLISRKKNFAWHWISRFCKLLWSVNFRILHIVEI